HVGKSLILEIVALLGLRNQGVGLTLYIVRPLLVSRYTRRQRRRAAGQQQHTSHNSNTRQPVIKISTQYMPHKRFASSSFYESVRNRKYLLIYGKIHPWPSDRCTAAIKTPATR